MRAFRCRIILSLKLDDHGRLFYSSDHWQRVIQRGAVRVRNRPRLAKQFWLLAAILQVPSKKLRRRHNLFINGSLQAKRAISRTLTTNNQHQKSIIKQGYMLVYVCWLLVGKALIEVWFLGWSPASWGWWWVPWLLHPKKWCFNPCWSWTKGYGLIAKQISHQEVAH